MKKILLAVLFSTLLTACASSTKVSQSINGDKESEPTYYSTIEIDNKGTSVPDHFILAIKSYLKQELIRHSIYSENAKNKIAITITDYRMRSGFTRAMFGVLAGKDGIESVVIIKNGETGEILGKSTVSSFNMLAIGEMDDVAKMHAEEIAEFVNNEQES